MWLLLLAKFLTSLGGGELFGPDTWFFCNDLLIIGTVMFAFPRISTKGNPENNVVTDFYTRKAAICLLACGWSAALYFSGSPDCCPVGGLMDLDTSIVHSSLAKQLGTVALVLHILGAGVLGFRGFRNPRQVLLSLPPPHNQCSPILQAVGASEQEQKRIAALKGLKEATVITTSVLLVIASLISYAGHLQSLLLFHTMSGLLHLSALSRKLQRVEASFIWTIATWICVAVALWVPESSAPTQLTQPTPAVPSAPEL